MILHFEILYDVQEHYLEKHYLEEVRFSGCNVRTYVHSFSCLSASSCLCVFTLTISESPTSFLIHKGNRSRIRSTPTGRIVEMYYHSNHGYETVKHPVCRFFVQGLSSSKGRAKSDVYVDLVLNVDGLLSLIRAVYDLMNQYFKTEESYRATNWRLHFHGDVFTIADPDIHHFHLLQYPIRNGQTGWFEGCNINFRFSILSVFAGETCSSKLDSYPRVYIGKSRGTLSADIKEDWLSDEMKNNAKDFHRRYRDYMAGANVWNQDASGAYFRDRPKPPKWTPTEEKILSLLVQSGHKFQESWQNILQFCFLNRSEVGTSQQWYKVRKRELSDLSSESDQSREDLVVHAKQLCRDLMEKHFKLGVPELGEHPLKRKNPILSETCDYQNSFSKPAKKLRTAEVC